MRIFAKYVGMALVSSLTVLPAANASVTISTPINLSVPINATGYVKNNVSFSLAPADVYSFSTGYTGTTSTLSDVTNTLYQWKNNAWTAIWGTTSTFDTGSNSYITGAVMSLAAGTYKFSSIAFFDPSSSNYTGSYVANISPVPEPETYAMMGVGLAAVLLRLRKKKVSSSLAAAV